MSKKGAKRPSRQRLSLSRRERTVLASDLVEAMRKRRVLNILQR